MEQAVVIMNAAGPNLRSALGTRVATRLERTTLPVQPGPVDWRIALRRHQGPHDLARSSRVARTVLRPRLAAQERPSSQCLLRTETRMHHSLITRAVIAIACSSGVQTAAASEVFCPMEE